MSTLTPPTSLHLRHRHFPSSTSNRRLHLTTSFPSTHRRTINSPGPTAAFSGDNKPQNKHGFRAPFVGLLFAAGVTLASISLFKRTTGSKQQQPPLTTELEVEDSVSLADQCVEIDHNDNEPDALLTEKERSQEIVPQVLPGKVLVPAVVDQVQGQALAALQVLKVIEADVEPGDLCKRREYARWLVAASSVLSRNAVSKVYPAMYIENVTEIAFDDIAPEDPDFSYIQGLAEAGVISSKLSRYNSSGSSEHQDPFLFSPESSLSRQDLVTWKMALGKRLLPEVNRNDLYECSGYIDIDRISPDAWPALADDLAAGELAITVLAFGYTRLFQPNKPVTKAQAAIALSAGDTSNIVAEELTRIEAESLAEIAVNAHTALVAEVEKDMNANFEKELANEREKVDAIEKMAEEARQELERLRAERKEEDDALFKGCKAVESEMDMLSRLRFDIEEQLQELMNNKMEIAFEKDRINKLKMVVETENHNIVKLQYELEVERKALSMARAWAEEEAKGAREQARVLEEARNRWERRGIKIVVDSDLQDDASTGITWLTAGEQAPVYGTISRAEKMVENLRLMAAEIKVNSSNVIERVIQKIVALISALREWAFELGKTINSKTTVSVERFGQKASDFGSKASRSAEELWGNVSEHSSSVRDKARRVIEDYKGSIDRITQKLKT